MVKFNDVNEENKLLGRKKKPIKPEFTQVLNYIEKLKVGVEKEVVLEQPDKSLKRFLNGQLNGRKIRGKYIDEVGKIWRLLVMKKTRQKKTNIEPKFVDGERLVSK